MQKILKKTLKIQKKYFGTGGTHRWNAFRNFAFGVPPVPEPDSILGSAFRLFRNAISISGSAFRPFRNAIFFCVPPFRNLLSFVASKTEKILQIRKLISILKHEISKFLSYMRSSLHFQCEKIWKIYHFLPKSVVFFSINTNLLFRFRANGTRYRQALFCNRQPT